LAALVWGWVGYQCLEYRAYIRNQAGNPIASDKLAAAGGSIPTVLIGSAVLCLGTIVGGLWTAHFVRRRYSGVSGLSQA
jgi:hypothetical protein